MGPLKEKASKKWNITKNLDLFYFIFIYLF